MFCELVKLNKLGKKTLQLTVLAFDSLLFRRESLVSMSSAQMLEKSPKALQLLLNVD